MKQQRSFSAWLLVIGIFGLAYAKEYQQHEQVDVINRGGSEANYQIKSVETTRPVANPSFSEDTAFDSSNGIKIRVRRGAMLCRLKSRPAQHATEINGLNGNERREWLEMCGNAKNERESNAVNHVHFHRQMLKQQLKTNSEKVRSLTNERNAARSPREKGIKNRKIANVKAERVNLIRESEFTTRLINDLKKVKNPRQRQATIDAIERLVGAQYNAAK